MATRVRRKGRKVRLDNNNRGRAGEFFEHLALSVVGGEFNENEDLRFGDIVDWKLGLGIEVKSSDNGHPFRLRIRQKRGYENILFPLSYFAYCLCSYRNRVSARKAGEFLRTRGRKAEIITLLHRYDKKTDQHKLLSGKVDEVFLFDIEVITALERLHGLHPGSHPGRQDEHEIRLRRRDLRPLVNGSFESLMSAMNLDIREWSRGKFVLERTFVIPDSNQKDFHSYTSKFIFYTILRKDLHRKFVSTRKLGRPIPAPSS